MRGCVAGEPQQEALFIGGRQRGVDAGGVGECFGHGGIMGGLGRAKQCLTPHMDIIRTSLCNLLQGNRLRALLSDLHLRLYRHPRPKILQSLLIR